MAKTVAKLDQSQGLSARMKVAASFGDNAWPVLFNRLDRLLTVKFRKVDKL